MEVEKEESSEQGGETDEGKEAMKRQAAEFREKMTRRGSGAV